MIRGGFPPIVKCDTKSKEAPKQNQFNASRILTLDEILENRKEAETKLNVVTSK